MWTLETKEPMAIESIAIQFPNTIQIDDPCLNKSTMVDCCTGGTHHHNGSLVLDNNDFNLTSKNSFDYFLSSLLCQINEALII